MFEAIKESLNTVMENAVKALQNQLAKVRTGRAQASLLDGVRVDYYGSPTPINQLGQVSTPEARLLQIQPFDKSIIADIEKAILGANLGVTPSNDGNLIRIPFPALTEDKRKDLVKSVKKMGEDAKVQMRNARREKNDQIKSAEKKKEISEDESKKYQGEVQNITDSFTKKIDEIIGLKEKELLTV